MHIKNFIISFLILIFVYSLVIEPNLIFLKEQNIKIEGIDKLKIVFVSDFHLSKFSNSRLKRIVDIVNSQNADIIISGGDYLKMHGLAFSLDMDEIADYMAKMKSKYGMYSVLGNHDYYKDSKAVKTALLKRGINILENNSIKLDINGKPLYIAGISDMQTTYYDLDKALKSTANPVILVSHSPDIFYNAEDRVDLILAGHTHGGQVRIPFFGAVIVPSKYGKKFESGFFENKMYITKGLGTSILPLRFNCAPEITVFNIN